MAIRLAAIPEIKVLDQDEAGLVILGYGSSTPPSTAGVFAPGCVIIDVSKKILYYNDGTTASPTWNSAISISASEIAAGAVTLAKLDTGVTPSHVVKFAATSAAYGGGGTSTAITVTGAASTDIATAVIRASTNAVSIVKAVLTTNTLTIHFSADPGAGTTVDYTILRAAA